MGSLAQQSLQIAKQVSRSSRFSALYVWEKRWLVAAAVIGVVLMQVPLPEGLTQDGRIVIMMTVVAVLMFVTEPVPLPAVALLIVIGEVFLLGLDSTRVAKTLMSDSVLFIMGSLMLAVAVVKQKLDKRIAWFIVRVTGTKTVNICFGITLVSGLLSSFIGEHTVAAMMLPVGVTLVSLTSNDPKKVRRLAVVIFLSIAYGCSVAAIGTPSGGARNAIMIGYWKEFFYSDGDPASGKYLVDYLRWMTFAYPMILIQIPIVIGILYMTFRPEYRDLSRAVVRLRTQLINAGPMRAGDWVAIVVFFLVLFSWITFSDRVGMGTIAIMGAAAFLVIGLVRWEDVNSGVNWGVVLIYAAAISLGVEMKQTGAAQWIAESFLALLAPFGASEGPGLWVAISVLTAAVSNTMSSGAAVAVLGPIVLNVADHAGESPLLIGFVTAISSSFAYMTVFAAPACAIVYASGYLKTTDFLAAGWKMMITSIIVVMLAALVYWPLLGL
jgi:sodium-dependent dicarboxylate transporter 2/3/5